MVTRFENWPLLLSAYLTERRAMPFEWGGNDCLTFAAKGVHAMTGVDFSLNYPAYSTEAEAIELLNANGGYEGIITAALGEGTDKYKTARRGDVALVMMGNPSAGLVDDSGQRVAVLVPNGLIRVPLTSAIKVWGV